MKNAHVPWSLKQTQAPHAAVLGGGAWGTALAAALQRSGYQALLWCRSATAAQRIDASGRNEAYLPGIRLPQGLRATADLAAAVHRADLVVVAVPSSALPEVSRQLARHVAAQVPVLVASKGVERDSGALMTEVVLRTMPQARVGVLSGPSFAAGVAQGEPTALTLALEGVLDAKQAVSHWARRLQLRLREAQVRLELTDDLAGAQVGGALKNVVAIACGLAAGRGMGANTRAAIVGRGMSDMLRLTLALGGRPETLLASCGIGDTLLTCTSEQSRNYRFGFRLGQGAGEAGEDKLVEGAVNAQTLAALESRLGLRLGAVSAVRDLVQGRISVDTALQRVLQEETDADRPPASVREVQGERLQRRAAPSRASLTI